MAEFYITSANFNIQERETKTRGKVYDVSFRVFTLDGQQIQKWLKGYKTKAQAKAGYAEFVTNHCETISRSMARSMNAKKEIITMGELVRDYIASKANQNKTSSIFDKSGIFKKYVLPKFEKTRIDKITQQDLFAWQEELWQTKKNGSYMSYRYLNKIRTYMNSVLTYAERKYGIANLLRNVPKPKNITPKKEMQFWTREQFEKFLSVIDDVQHKALFATLFFTGRRKGEILALSPKDINLEKKTIHIAKSVTRKTINGSPWEVTSTKANKIADSIISPALMEHLAPYFKTIKKSADFVFSHDGRNPIPENTLTRIFKRYIKKAELPDIRIHDLRHSFVSMMIHRGANMTVVADLISDNVQQVMMTYGHLYVEDKNELMNALI